MKTPQPSAILRNPHACFFKTLLTLLLVALTVAQAAWAGEDLASCRKLYLHGKHEEAREGYQELFKQQATRLAAALGLSLVAEAKGDLPLALRLVKEEHLQSPHPSLAARQASLLFTQGKWDEALALAEEALKKEPANLPARWTRAEIWWAQGNLDKALAEFRWFVKTYSERIDTPQAINKPEELLLVARASLQNARWHALGDELGTILDDLLRDALKQDGDFWPAEALAGQILAEKHNRPESLAAFDKVLTINPSAAEALTGKGELSLERMEYADAEKFAQRALETRPGDADALHLLGQVHLAQGNFTQARQELDKARSALPRNEKILGCLAGLNWMESKFAALQELEKEVASFDSKPEEFYLHFGESLSRHRHYTEAERRLKQAAAPRPNLPEPHIALGMLFMQMGREAEALPLLEKGFQGDPFHIRLANTLKVLRHLQKYETLKTEHFIIRYDKATDQGLAQFASMFLEQNFSSLALEFRFTPKEPILIELFSTHEMFSGRTVALPDLHTIGACTGKVVTMVSPHGKGQGKPFNWARVLKHELTHVFNLEQSQFLVPHWLTEGLAVKQEGYPRPAMWDQELKKRVAKGTLMDLSNINLGFQRPRSPLDWQMAYCQSLLYVEYLEKKHGKEASRKLLESFAQGLGLETALAQALQTNREDFEKGYQGYLKELTDKIPAQGSAKRSLEELKQALKDNANDADALGEMALATLARNRAEARKLAEEALTKKANQPHAALVLARLARQAGDSKTEKTLLEAAAKDHPMPDVWFALGRLHYDAGEFAKAAEAFEQGAAMEPADNRWLEQLARVYAQTGETAKQLDALRKLSLLTPDDLDRRKKLLQLLVQGGDKEEAVKAAREVLEIDIRDKQAREVFLKHLKDSGRDADFEKLQKAFTPE
ncbi:MAG: tetratricopeptide repeat protein [Gemmataceae bacterium]|nr:tetratricopeptide repeat protein [Gemmataceae bacterium]